MDGASDLKTSPTLMNCAYPNSRCRTYSELFLGLLDADAGMILVRADHSANGAHRHPTRTAVDAVHLLMLLAPPLWHVVHSRYKRMALEHGWLQVNPQVLWAHGGTAHQAGLHSRPVLTTGAVVADYRATSWRPFTGFIRSAWRFWRIFWTPCLFLIAVGGVCEFLWGLLGLGVDWQWWLLFRYLYSTTGCVTKLSVSLTILWTWYTGWSRGYLGCGLGWRSVRQRRRSLSFRWRCFCGCFLFCRCLISRWVIDDSVVFRWTCA